MTLAEARTQALEYRRLARRGGDPAAEGPSVEEPDAARPSHAPTFRQVAAEIIDFHRPTWRNSKSAAQWEASLRDYAFPVLGDMRVDEIMSADVLRAIQPIWNTKRETAQRTRQRISAVMKAAVAAGHRADNPAGDALAAALPRGGRAQRHQRAVPHGEVAGVIATVRRSNALPTTKLAFESC